MITSRGHLAHLIVPCAVVALGLACTEAGPTDPASATVEGAALDARQVLDVAGTWNWTREEKLTIPAAFAFVFGIQPEGPITHFECDVSGVITLEQVGNSLSGTEVETFSRCETRGGQVFPQPGLGVLIPITEGSVRGRSVELLIGDALVPCPIRAVVTAVDGDRAIGLRGTGRCFVPGHPRSDAPAGHPFDLDPPPAGTEKIVAWSAVR